MNRGSNKDFEDQLTSNRRLNDESINLAHYIIHRQFPDVNGLEDTNMGDKDMYSVYIKKIRCRIVQFDILMF